MRRVNIISALAAGVVAAILVTSTAQANKLAGPIVTGYVTSVQGIDSITVDERTYTIEPGSPAVEELSSISPGQQVDLQLNGPASSPDTQVVNVVVHQGQ